MQHTTGVAVLATELPAADRRALSQAWYSALHLAERAPRARSAPPSAQQRTAASHAAPGTVAPPRAAAGTSAGTGWPATPAPSARSARPDFAAPLTERRAPRSELARRIERGLTRRPPDTTASFALAAAGGRVRILVRSDGGRIRLVALCAPALRERVERALAQARFALAARGVRAEVA